MVLLGYFYRESRDSHPTEAWSTSFNPHSTITPTKAVGTSALKSRSRNQKPMFSSTFSTSPTSFSSHPQPQSQPQYPSRSRSSSFNNNSTNSNIAYPLPLQDPCTTSSFAVSNDGTIYEWTNPASSNTFPPVFNRSRVNSFASTMNPFASSAMSSRTDATNTTSSASVNSNTDRKSRGRSSSVWSTSTGLSTVRSRSRSSSESLGSD